MKFCIFITLAIILNLISCNSSKQQKPPIAVSAVELIADYNENESSADEKYKERIVEITGDVANVSQIQGTVGVLLENYNPKSRFGVICLSDKPQAKTFHDLKRGQSVTFVGMSDGKVSEYMIRITDCEIK